MTSNLIVGKPFSMLTLNWRNIGVAPTYENWDVVFEIKDNNNVTIWTGVSQSLNQNGLYLQQQHQS